MIKLPALKGYVLEEGIAKLLANNGYRLLTEKGQDPEALTHGPHGLLVKGRGTDHQADALGDLLVPVPFSLPVRLFVEAKYRRASVRLTDVRNALGVIADVNEQYATALGNSTSRPTRRYHYRYSPFSTSGFSAEAEDFALAQQISLIDLQGSAFGSLRASVTSVAEQILALANQERLESMPMGQVRTALRLALGTWTAPTTGDPASRQPDLANELNPALAEEHRLPIRALSAISTDFANELQEDLVLGFPPAPFILALRPDDVEAFHYWALSAPPEIEVNIRFASRGDVTGDWVIAPANDGPLLRFGLPPVLTTWLLAVDGAEADRALKAKKELLSTIAIYVGNRTLTMRFRPIERHRRDSGAMDRAEYEDLRAELSDPSLAWPPSHDMTADDGDVTVPIRAGVWTAAATVELLRRLDAEGWVHAKALRAAALADGRIDRSSVYELAGYPPDRSLNGFTRPVRRLARQLQREGILSDQPEVALRPHYLKGGKASYFSVPEDLLFHLRHL